MEQKSQPIESFLAALQKDAEKRKTAIVVEARIAITPERWGLLEVRPIAPLAVIRY